MRLIDADDAQKEFIKRGNIEWLNKHAKDAYQCACEILDEAPTVDAVEVVRCWDCIHGRELLLDKKEPEIMICIHPKVFPMRIYPGFYCAHGRRKSGAEVEE